MAIPATLRIEPAAPYWTHDDYHAAIDTGVFGDRRIELIGGALYEMPPMREPHIAATHYLAYRFFTVLPMGRVRSQTPIILDHDGEPEPDLTIVPHEAAWKPNVRDVQLVVEVTHSTRNFDRGIKLEAYLADGAREVWIVDLVEESVLVYRHGRLFGVYSPDQQETAGARLSAVEVPEVEIALDEVFAAARHP